MGSTRRFLLPLITSLAAIVFVATPLPAVATGGDFDGTFGGDGRVLTGFHLDVAGRSVAIAPDGRIVVAGETQGRFGRFAAVRYRRSGRLDPTFGADGRVRTSFGLSSGASDVAVQEDGRILAVGARHFTLGSDVQRFALARYRVDGALDPTFGGDGTVTTPFATSARGIAVAIQADGKIVAVGSRGGAFAVARYAHDGSLDQTFGGDGKAVYRVALGGDPSSVAIQPDGKILIGGTVFVDAENTDVALLRLDEGGGRDASFDGDGALTAHIGGPSSRLSDVALQADGRIVVSGSSGDLYNVPRTSTFAVGRFLSDGSLDGTFSGDGKARYDFGFPANAASVLVQSDGRIVAVGTAGGDIGNFALVRYTAAGVLDPTFGTGGHLVTNFGDAAGNAALQANGKIVAAGTEYFPGQRLSKIAVARFLAT